jgi:hypothetical protein
MNKPILERVIYMTVILLSLIALVLLAYSQCFSPDTKLVYQGF